MELRGTREGVGVTLRPIGYQLPRYDPDDPDVDLDELDELDDWLVIECEADDPRGSWTFVNPCLTVDEAEELSVWLSDVAHGKVASPRFTSGDEIVPDLRFCEPNLSLSLASRSTEVIGLRVHFSYESRPPWAVGHTTSLQNWIEIEMTPSQLLASVEAWGLEAAMFPQRT